MPPNTVSSGWTRLVVVALWGLLSGLLLTVTALATTVTTTMNSDVLPPPAFEGSYADPNHPNCLRNIEIHHFPQVIVSGTDGSPGCPPDGSGKAWTLEGRIQLPEATSVLIDFSPKGGPKDLLGTWVNLPQPGILFPDGNLWAKLDTTPGEEKAAVQTK